MPHPAASDAIAATHAEFYSANYPEAIQVFSGGVRLLNPNGDNPAVIPISTEEKMLMGLTELVSAYRIRVFGRGDRKVDAAVQASATWALSFDDGATQYPHTLSGAIAPDKSMTCWEFVLYRSLSNG